MPGGGSPRWGEQDGGTGRRLECREGVRWGNRMGRTPHLKEVRVPGEGQVGGTQDPGEAQEGS